MLAAKQAGRIVGYAFVRIRRGAGFAESWRVADSLADLATLSVLPELRGQGIGSSLMDAVEARLGEMGIADMAITVIATNAEAIPSTNDGVPFRLSPSSFNGSCLLLDSSRSRDAAIAGRRALRF